MKSATQVWGILNGINWYGDILSGVIGGLVAIGFSLVDAQNVVCPFMQWQASAAGRRARHACSDGFALFSQFHWLIDEENYLKLLLMKTVLVSGADLHAVVIMPYFFVRPGR